MPRLPRAQGSGLTFYVILRHIWGQHLEYITGMAWVQKVSVVALLFNITLQVAQLIDTYEDFETLREAKRARIGLMLRADADEPGATWQVCIEPIAIGGRGGSVGATWVDMLEPWAHKTEVVYQGTKDFGDIWQVCMALGPAAYPRISDAQTEVVFESDGGVWQVNRVTGTRRAVRRVVHTYGCQKGAVHRSALTVP